MFYSRYPDSVGYRLRYDFCEVATLCTWADLRDYRNSPWHQSEHRDTFVRRDRQYVCAWAYVVARKHWPHPELVIPSPAIRQEALQIDRTANPITERYDGPASIVAISTATILAGQGSRLSNKGKGTGAGDNGAGHDHKCSFS